MKELSFVLLVAIGITGLYFNVEYAGWVLFFALLGLMFGLKGDVLDTFKALFNYLKALRLCAVQVFNANQVTGHQHIWLVEAVKSEEEAWDALPMWARRWLNKHTRGGWKP
jgi:hypothetical protein